MTIVYLNTKSYGAVETLDHLSSTDFSNNLEFRAEKKRLKAEYQTAHNDHGVYWSSRCTNSYK